MAESNLSSLAFITESVWGTTPATPELQLLRQTGNDIRHNKGTVKSAELRSDRMTADLAQVDASVEGTVNFELSYGTYDTLFESAMYDAWTTLSIVSLASLDIAGQVITGTAGDFNDVLVGGWIKIAGATTVGNNGIKRVVGVAVDGSTITLATGSLTGSDLNETLTFTAGDLRNGITEKSFTFERNIPHNGTDFFQLFTGVVMAQLSLDIAIEKIITGAFSLIGSVGASQGSTTIDNAGGYTAVNTNTVMNGTNEVGGIYYDTYSATAPTNTAMIPGMKQLAFTINNNNRALKKLGSLGAFDLGVGEMDLSGTMDLYFQSNVIFAEFVAHTYKALSLQLSDSAGNIYMLTFPRIQLSDANPPVEGKNVDVMQKVAFTALADSLSGAQMIINRFPA